MGRIGERGEAGHWDSFIFEILTNDGDRETITITEDDLPKGDEFDWDWLFDLVDDWADEYDVDYENSYGESE